MGPKNWTTSLRCIMEQFTKRVDGQYKGQNTPATLRGLQIPHCAKNVCRQPNEDPGCPVTTRVDGGGRCREEAMDNGARTTPETSGAGSVRQHP